MDETNLKAEDYKNICWFYLQYLEKVDDNWRTGSYKMKTSLPSYVYEIKFAVGEDFITTFDDRYKYVHIFDRESVELKRHFRPNCPQYQIIDMNTVVYPGRKFLTFHDTSTGKLVKRFELNESPSRFDAFCPTAKLWTVLTGFERVLQLDLLRVDNASNVALLKTVEVAHPDHYKFQVDEQFILHQQQKKTNAIANYPEREITTCHFISTRIVHNSGLERSLSVMYRIFRSKYERGLMFFIYRDGLIRILDVASGTYLHDIPRGIIGYIDAIKVNSNYVVIIDRSNLYVYSLLALRSPLPSDAFVFKIKHNHEELIDVLIDEAQIVCLGMRYFSLEGKEITVFDFGS